MGFRKDSEIDGAAGFGTTGAMGPQTTGFVHQDARKTFWSVITLETERQVHSST